MESFPILTHVVTFSFGIGVGLVVASILTSAKLADIRTDHHIELLEKDAEFDVKEIKTRRDVAEDLAKIALKHKLPLIRAFQALVAKKSNGKVPHGEQPRQG